MPRVSHRLVICPFVNRPRDVGNLHAFQVPWVVIGGQELARAVGHLDLEGCGSHPRRASDRVGQQEGRDPHAGRHVRPALALTGGRNPGCCQLGVPTPGLGGKAQVRSGTGTCLTG